MWRMFQVYKIMFRLKIYYFEIIAHTLCYWKTIHVRNLYTQIDLFCTRCISQDKFHLDSTSFTFQANEKRPRSWIGAPKVVSKCHPQKMWKRRCNFLHLECTYLIFNKRQEYLWLLFFQKFCSWFFFSKKYVIPVPFPMYRPVTCTIKKYTQETTGKFKIYVK